MHRAEYIAGQQKNRTLGDQRAETRAKYKAENRAKQRIRQGGEEKKFHDIRLLRRRQQRKRCAQDLQKTEQSSVGDP